MPIINLHLFQYAHLIVSLDYMVSLPGAYKERDFIFEYRKAVAVGTKDVIFGAKVSLKYSESRTG